ncbi:calcium-dependent protein kinase 14-like [Bidens hawaiensis]|uniref:calcium-dependent protein kinase 14-like n=1 Tax=Bidens hawaiensis TaxID=980011 RepID=UPI00404A6D13
MADKGQGNKVFVKDVIEPLTFSHGTHTAIGQLSREKDLRTPKLLKEKGYTLGGVLGKGSFAKVYKCTENETGQVFGCKITRKIGKLDEDIEMANTELEIMKGLPVHPNLVAWKDGFNDERTIVILMELCEGGTLFDQMKNKVSPTEEFHSCPQFCDVIKKVPFTEGEAATVIRHIIEAIKACHENGVMRLDVKPDNIVLTDVGENTTYKLIDFGLSLKFTGQKINRQPIGITSYTAPEITKGECGKEADIWSAGAILYELLSGIPPFSSPS